QAYVFASIRAVRYKPFFLRSAQRFFIASDNRFLPSGVRPPRLRLFDVVPFFLRAAQRFFIAIDNRFLPSGVRPPRLRFFDVLPLGLPTPIFLPACDKADPNSAAIARPSLSLSSLNSSTNLSRSKIRSFGALARWQLAPLCNCSL